MTIDMSQFFQVFFEETDEHLSTIESLLVAVDIDSPDSEDLNAIFRAAHSIKGSSGTFGFTDMMDVTHVMETLLDRVRKNELPLSAPIVDACLEAGDVLRNLLSAHRGEGEADMAAATAVCARLDALCADPDPAGASTAPQPQAEAGQVLEIAFHLDAGARADHTIVDAMMEELRAHGQLQVVEPDSADGMWRLRLETSADPADISGIIGFVAEAATVEMTISSHEEAVADAEGDDGAFGFFDDLDDTVPAVSAEAAPADDDDGFGLFEPMAAEPVTDAETPIEVPAEMPAEVSEDTSFGLFAPVVVPDEPVAMAPIADAGPAATPVAAAPAAGAPKAAAKAAADTSIRVSVEKVDQMINLVGELVITQAMLQQSASDIDPVVFERLMSGLGQLERNTRDLQESVMSIRMMPISMVFSRFPRVVRDLSRKLGKQVELKLSGENTELDKGLIERIADPLTHLIRNSLDHGIEGPERRRQAGKPETGTITLNAAHQGGYIIIEVGDDGAGLNRDKILSKARERGLAVSDTMSDGEVWQLIFEPGFSTADKVTDVSGRGVGMDVVKRNIAEMGGNVEIESMTGIGTRMTVRLPLTLAILDGMSVAVGEETYVLPLNTIVESLQPEAGQIRTLSRLGHVIQVRGEYLPVVRLHEVFGCAGAQTDLMHGLMIVVEANGSKAALFVDWLLGQHQVVIKSLDANFRRVQGISGATIMGDGRVALIIDVAGVIAMAQTPASLAA